MAAMFMLIARNLRSIDAAASVTSIIVKRELYRLCFLLELFRRLRCFLFTFLTVFLSFLLIADNPAGLTLLLNSPVSKNLLYPLGLVLVVDPFRVRSSTRTPEFAIATCSLCSTGIATTIVGIAGELVNLVLRQCLAARVHDRWPILIIRIFRPSGSGYLALVAVGITSSGFLCVQPLQEGRERRIVA